VIDPVLVYSTFLGGSAGVTGLIDYATAIAVDAAGSAYVTGETVSADFPATAGAFDSTCGSSGSCAEAGIVSDAFVAKLSPDGTALVYATYLGGRSRDSGAAIAVDADGHAYVTGTTESDDFPTTAGAFQPSCTVAGFACMAGFLSKLSPDGTALVYSTYLMGGKNGPFVALTAPRGLAVDPLGSAYVTGLTYSTSFPTTPGAFQTAAGGGGDAFVLKLNAAGSAAVYSTYLGGRATDYGTAIAVGADGAAYVAGATSPWQQRQVNDFPVTPGAFQTACASNAYGFCDDGFVAKLSPDGSALVYSTYLGGATDFDRPLGIAVDAAGHAYVTGATKSSDFPTTGLLEATGSRPDPYGSTGFVTKLSLSGSALVYSVLLDGAFSGQAIAVDSAGHAFVAGDANPYSFVPKNPWQASGLNYDALVLKLDPAGRLGYSVLLGGFGNDAGLGLALDPEGAVYVTGYATSYDFPLQAAMEMRGHRAFVAKLAETTASADLALTMRAVLGAAPPTERPPVTLTILAVNHGPDDAGGVTVQVTLGYEDEVEAVAPSQGACRRTSPVTGDLIVCDLGTLPRGASATVTLVVRQEYITQDRWTATVNSATADDPNRRDNRVSSPALLHPVTISRAGAGRGTVRSAPPGIDCGETCSALFDTSSIVTLRAVPDAGFTFGGWSGDCRRRTEIITECEVDVAFAPSVTAVFADTASPTIAFGAPVYTAGERRNDAVITVVRSGNVAGFSEVTVRTSDGSARAGRDYAATQATLTFAPGDTVQTMGVYIVDDALANGTRRLNLALSAVKGARLGEQRAAVLEIQNDEAGGTIQFDAGGVFAASEGARTALVTVTRTGDKLGGGVTVRYTAAAESATVADFAPASGTLTFGPGATSVTFPVTIRDNAAVNPAARTIRLALSTPTGGAVLGEPSTGQLTIVDDDNPGTVQLAADTFTVNESAGAAVITVTRTGTKLGGGVTVRFQTGAGSAQPGRDYTEVARTLTFAAGQTRQTVSVPIRNNQLADGERTLAITLLDAGAGAAIGPPAAAVLRIVDDDQPVVRFAAPAATMTEGGVVTLTLTRARGLGSPVSVDVAITGGTARPCPAEPCDVALDATHIVFAPGQTTRTVKVSASGDTRVNGLRTVELTLGVPSVGTVGMPATATVTIRDDDQGGTIQFAPTALAVVEGTTAALTVTRAGSNLASEVTVDFAITGGTAVAGVDFILEAGRLAFAAGQRSLTIPVPTLPHAGAPATRTATVTLGNATGGATLNGNAALRTATLTIRAAPAP